MVFWDSDDGRDSKRSLTQREKQFLYENAKGRCENPACNRKITFFEMQVGHKIAYSKKGRTTLKNSVCLCYKCNHDQGTDSWEVFLRKRGVKSKERIIKETKEEMKQSLQALTLPQLKLLATKYKIKLKSVVEESIFSTKIIAPTKADYVKKLSQVVTVKDLKSLPKPEPKPAKKKSPKKSDSWW